MNYLAHLYFAQQTADSHMGNLLGDFRRGVDISQFNSAVLKGLSNHQKVDRYTDQHVRVKASKALFAKSNRRFAPVALDVLYDHFLCKTWDDFGMVPFSQFTQSCYRLLSQRLVNMPPRMQTVVTHMVNNDGLSLYNDMKGVNKAISHLSSRIRFSNSFASCIDDIAANYDELYSNFLRFLPDLIQHVQQDNPELGLSDHCESETARRPHR